MLPKESSDSSKKRPTNREIRSYSMLLLLGKKLFKTWRNKKDWPEELRSLSYKVTTKNPKMTKHSMRNWLINLLKLRPKDKPK